MQLFLVFHKNPNKVEHNHIMNAGLVKLPQADISFFFREDFGSVLG